MRFPPYLTSIAALSLLLCVATSSTPVSAIRKDKANTVAKIARTEREGSFERAFSLLQEALLIHRELGDIDGQAAVLSQMGELFSQQDQPELAIIFYKQSINIIESIRSDLSGLPADLQQSFTGTVSNIYRDLADLLLQEDRILEAQQVLDLLRVQELEEYLKNVRGNSKTASGIEYQLAEQAFLAKYQRQQETAIELAQERADLRDKYLAGTITAEEEARREELSELNEKIGSGFNTFINSPEIVSLIDQLVQKTGGATVELNDLASLRNNLAELDAALLYPLILDSRIELVITTGETEPLRRTIQTAGRKEINRAVSQYRQALQDPSSDAVTPAQELYKWIVEPIEADLRAAGVETIIYSPDGALRYIPLSALHDGEGWLAERFRINNITAKSLEELDSEPQPTPRILAGAFADDTKTHLVGGVDYYGLPSAGLEVNLLDKTVPDTTSLFDDDFKFEAIKPDIELYNILHFATHASFVAGNPAESFILFGNGGTQNLKQIENWSLSEIDLVVLSACETGLGQFDNNGEQILGLGYQFQKKGANAVIASLWQVNDGSTQVLMNEFYNQLGQGVHKNEAIQQAQLSMIRSDLTVAEAIDRSTGLLVVDTETGEPVTPSNGKINHPYYWAPFILIGNGL